MQPVGFQENKERWTYPSDTQRAGTLVTLRHMHHMTELGMLFMAVCGAHRQKAQIASK